METIDLAGDELLAHSVLESRFAEGLEGTFYISNAQIISFDWPKARDVERQLMEYARENHFTLVVWDQWCGIKVQWYPSPTHPLFAQWINTKEDE